MSMIYHITSHSTAVAAQKVGEYRTESLNKEGFIHFSQLHQLLGVANSFYGGQSDLVILVVDSSRLKAELRYEPPAHPGTLSEAPGEISLLDIDQLFPHLFGPLNFDAVLKVVDFPSVAGRFELPLI